VISQIPHAFLRALCVAAVVMLPSLLIPRVATDTAEIVVVIAVLGALLTFMEYYGRYPSIIEFRFAPPFNRLRFAALAVPVVVLSLIIRAQTDPGMVGLTLARSGSAIGHALDFPYSPIRLVLLALPANSPAWLVYEVRTAAAVSYAGCLAMIVVFLALVRFRNWPMRNRAFNVWINLPLFDPTRGGDLVERLRRDGGINIVLGFLLPFMIPTILATMPGTIGPETFADPQTLIWMITAWAFLPASMVIRGMALLRVADLIGEKRRRVIGAAIEQKAPHET